MNNLPIGGACCSFLDFPLISTTKEELIAMRCHLNSATGCCYVLLYPEAITSASSAIQDASTCSLRAIYYLLLENLHQTESGGSFLTESTSPTVTGYQTEFKGTLVATDVHGHTFK